MSVNTLPQANTDTLFTHVPPHLRAESLAQVKGQLALTFPAGYTFKAKGVRHWTLLKPLGSDGMVVRTHTQKKVVLDFVYWLQKHGIEHKVEKL